LFLSESNISPLEQIQEKSFQDLNTLFKIFVILYADDTVVLAESEEGMQNTLDIFQLYCKQWKLEVNVNKTTTTKISKRKSRSNFEFKLQHETIEVVDSFSYLGILFKYNGCFSESRKKLVNQAQKSLFSIYKKY
jgi:MarR-like DNA-binding transcriptional regulator SgrR of sgrS sRNA